MPLKTLSLGKFLIQTSFEAKTVEFKTPSLFFRKFLIQTSFEAKTVFRKFLIQISFEAKTVEVKTPTITVVGALRGFC